MLFSNVCSHSSGVLKKIIQEGSGGCPNEGDEVIAHYTGTLDDGTKFDSSRDRGKEFKFSVGRRNVSVKDRIREKCNIWFRLLRAGTSVF